MLRRELDKEGVDPNDTFLLHTIMTKKYKSERKRRKLLLAALAYSEVDVNLRDVSGKTALHSAVEVSVLYITIIRLHLCTCWHVVCTCAVVYWTSAYHEIVCTAWTGC